MENKEPKDKRTKEWKEWKAKFDEANSTGLGDVIEKVTEVTGIKKAVEFVAGKDCGCDKRKEKANQIRFKHNLLRCFTEEQYNQWGEFIERARKSNKVSYQEQIDIVIPIYAHLFARQLKPKKCCLENEVDAIDKVYQLYQ